MLQLATGISILLKFCFKGFFKRSTLKKEQYRCYFGNKCPLMPENRNRCKACRFSRCLQVGMSIEGVKMGRIPKAEKEKALMDEYENRQKELFLHNNINTCNPQEKFFRNTNVNNFMLKNENNYAYNNYANNLVFSNNNQHQYSNFNYYQPKQQNFYTSSSSSSSSSSSLSSSSNEKNFPKFHSNYNLLPNITTTSNNNSNMMMVIEVNEAHKEHMIPYSTNYYQYHNLPTQGSTISFNNNINSLNFEPQSRIQIENPSLNNNIIKENANKLIISNNNFDEENRLSSMASFIEIDQNNLVDQMHTIYLSHNEKVFHLVQQAQSMGRNSNNMDNVTLQTVWVGLVESIPQVVKSMIVFAKEIPGIKDLKNTGDFAIMINNRLFDYFIVSLFSIYWSSNFLFFFV